MTNSVCDLFGTSYPLVMGGISPDPVLGSVVSNAGGLGCIEGVMPPDGLRDAIHRFREMSDKPFSINFPLAQGSPEPRREGAPLRASYNALHEASVRVL